MKLNCLGCEIIYYFSMGCETIFVSFDDKIMLFSCCFNLGLVKVLEISLEKIREQFLIWNSFRFKGCTRCLTQIVNLRFE